MIFLTAASVGQTIIIDSCGLDNEIKLNKYESSYFHKTLNEVPKDFSFFNKIVGFAYGNSGKIIISKRDYFDRWGKSYFEKGNKVINTLIILNENEKAKSGGYDAIIVSWSKINIDDKRRQKIIKKLRNVD